MSTTDPALGRGLLITACSCISAKFWNLGEENNVFRVTALWPQDGSVGRFCRHLILQVLVGFLLQFFIKFDGIVLLVDEP